MSIRSSPLRRLDKPQAMVEVLDLIGDSARAARSLTGYLDYADGEPHWRPPRSEHAAGPDVRARSFRAPADTVSRGLEYLAQHRRDLPTQAFVFVVSDFLVPAEELVWQRALEHRWELVPVVVADPVWERGFPDVGGVTVSYAEPATGAVVPVHLTRAEAARLGARHEQRARERTRTFRSLGLEPVEVHSHDPAEVLSAFLRWADLRVMVRGAVA